MNPSGGLDVIDRLKLLGDAAEELVEPVTAVEVLAERAPATEARNRRSRVLLGAAAAVVAISGVGFGVRFLANVDANEPVVVGTASDGSANGGAITDGATNGGAPDEDAPAESDGAEAATRPATGSRSDVEASGALAIREEWAQLRMCESGGDYRVAGNGFYGAYQFDWNTWQTVAGERYPGAPSDAPPIVQDEAALRLFHRKGSQPWPVCGDSLSGAATSPVVSGWMDHALPNPRDFVEFLNSTVAAEGPNRADYVVFLNPDVTETDLRRVEAQLVTNLAPLEGSVSWTFVDKDMAYAEFKQLFSESSDLVENVSPDLLPPSYRVFLDDAASHDSPLDPLAVLIDQLQSDPSVLRVTGDDPTAVAYRVGPDLLVHIERFTGSHEFRRADLSQSLAEISLASFGDMNDLAGYELGGNRFVISGHGVDPSDPFVNLADLVAGDRISLTPAPHIGPLEFVVEVNALVDAHAADLPPEGSLTLTTEGTDPDSRRIVIAAPVDSGQVVIGGG